VSTQVFLDIQCKSMGLRAHYEFDSKALFSFEMFLCVLEGEYRRRGTYNRMCRAGGGEEVCPRWMSIP
jgi:hypothetical protein